MDVLSQDSEAVNISLKGKTEDVAVLKQPSGQPAALQSSRHNTARTAACGGKCCAACPTVVTHFSSSFSSAWNIVRTCLDCSDFCDGCVKYITKRWPKVFWYYTFGDIKLASKVRSNSSNCSHRIVLSASSLRSWTCWKLHLLSGQSPLRRNTREFSKRSNPNGRRTQKSALERAER